MKKKPFTISLLIFALFSLVLPACTSTRVPTGSADEFQQYLNTAVPALRRKYHVEGVAVVLIQDGDVGDFLGFGYADKASKTPVTKDTIFQAGSISKSFAAWGVMDLVEDGLISLDAPVETYLTRWHLPESEFDPDGVTIRRLLQHTAGLSLHGYLGFEPSQTLPSLEASLSGDTNGCGDVHIVAEPGTVWSYSGGGYTLLQLVIEEVSGQSFADYIQQHVLTPLDMQQSGYSWEAQTQEQVATGYRWWGNPFPNYLFTAKAAAGLYTTPPDLAKFVAATMATPDGQTPGRDVLTADTLTLMLEPNPIEHNYGLGYQIETLENGEIVARHGGSNLGWKSMIVFMPSRNQGIVIMTNSEHGAYLYDEIKCDWLYWITKGQTNDPCKDAENTEFLAIAGGLVLALAIFVTWHVIKLRNGRRYWDTKLTLWRIIRIGVLLLLLFVWWNRFYGGEKIVMAIYFPHTLIWLSWAFTLWVLALLVTSFTHKATKNTLAAR